MDDLDSKIDDFNCAHDGEPSQESHGSPNKTESCGELDLLVPLDLVEGGRVKVDLDKLQRGWWLLFTFEEAYQQIRDSLENITKLS